MPRKLILKLHQSLDGYICTPGKDVSWMFDDFDDELTKWEVDQLWQAGLHIMGRGVYREMAEYWPTSNEPFAPPMNKIPKLIFSSILNNRSDWERTTITDDDLEDVIPALKGQDGKDILAHGGVGFARALSRKELVDEYLLFVHPQALGEGLPFFAEPASLNLIEVNRFKTGVLVLRYAKK